MLSSIKSNMAPIFDFGMPVLLICLGAWWIILGNVHGWDDLKNYAIGVGGAGLALLQQSAKNQLNMDKGGKVILPPAALDPGPIPPPVAAPVVAQP